MTVAGLSGDGVVKCSRSVLLKPDQGLEQVKSNKYDALVLPGGKVGTDNLAAVRFVGQYILEWSVPKNVCMWEPERSEYFFSQS